MPRSERVGAARTRFAVAVLALLVLGAAGCAAGVPAGSPARVLPAAAEPTGAAPLARPPAYPPVGTYALVYNGPVAAPDAPEAAAAIAEKAGLPVVYVADISQVPRLLAHARIFIVGGTEDDLGPLKAAFTPEVSAAVERYLQGGGRYLGICGGGFLGSTGWEDDPAFVPMLGLAPAQTADLDEDYRPRIVTVRWLGTQHPMYFQAGPTFQLQPTSESVRVIAEYPDGQIAALVATNGRGKVALIGPHPEARADWAEETGTPGRWRSTDGLLVDLVKDLLSADPVTP